MRGKTPAVRLNGLLHYARRPVPAQTDRNMPKVMARPSTHRTRDSVPDRWSDRLIDLMLSN